MSDTKWSRRDFFKLGGAAFLAAAVPSCAGQMDTMEAALASLPVDPHFTPHVASAWIARSEHIGAYALFRNTMEAATDFSWLSRGDSVLIKLALNSGRCFPATSDPWALSFLIRLLREKGAGRIMAGDSSGIETVHWTHAHQKGASRTCCRKAGLLDVIEQTEATAVFFEEAGYDGFVPVYPSGKHHWKAPPWIPSMLNEVDHIVYLARVSAHVMGDITSGMKTGVGFLREDSRRCFHCGGESFYAMYEEVNHIPDIAHRLRMVVSSGRKVLATFGPDKGHVTNPEYGLLFASEHLLAHEALAYAWLLYNRERETGFLDAGINGRLTRIRSLINKGFVWTMWEDGSFLQTPAIPLFVPGNIYAHPSIFNCMKRHGGRPDRIDWESVNTPPGAREMVYYIRDKIVLAA